MEFTTDDYDREFSQPKQPANWPDISPATRQGPNMPDTWRLHTVSDTAWKEDPCGISVVIGWILPADVVRLDIVQGGGIAVVSFQGTTDNVRKHTMQWLALYVPEFALDHAAYIGAELERADTERIDYVQDGKALRGEFRECGCCGEYHNLKWNGDCRKDSERFTYAELKDKGVRVEQLIGLEE